MSIRAEREIRCIQNWRVEASFRRIWRDVLKEVVVVIVVVVVVDPEISISLSVILLLSVSIPSLLRFVLVLLVPYKLRSIKGRICINAETPNTFLQPCPPPTTPLPPPPPNPKTHANPKKLTAFPALAATAKTPIKSAHRSSPNSQCIAFKHAAQHALNIKSTNIHAMANTWN